MKLNLQLFLVSQAYIFGQARAGLRGALQDVQAAPQDSAEGQRELSDVVPRESIDVCVGSSETVGTFTPDPNKYYTIRGSVTNQPWVMEDNTNSIAPDTPFGIVTRGGSATEADEKAHWRFIHDQQDNWIIVNRFNGMHVSLNADPSKIGITRGVQQQSKLAQGRVIPSGGGLSWNFQCSTDLARVIIHGPELEVPSCDPGINGCNEIFPRDGNHISMGPRTTIETKNSGCTRLRDTCSGLFGSRFRQVSKDGCGLFQDRLICRATKPPPHDDFVSEEWLIEELTVFSKRGPNPLEIPPIVVADFRKPSVVSNALVLGSDLLIAGVEFGLGSKGLLGALGGSLFAWTLRETLNPVTDTESQERAALQENIKKLADDLTEQTEKMINADLASEGLRETKNRINRRREWYLTGYPDQKEVDIAKPDELKTLAAFLKTHATEFDNDIFAYYGDGAATSEGDATARVTRATIGFDFLTLAVMDNLYVLQEAMLLDTFADSDIDCEDQVKTTFNMDFFVDGYSELLVATQNMLIDFQTEQECCTVSRGNVLAGGQVRLPFSADPFEESITSIGVYKQEVEHDVKFLSFNMEAMLAFFDSYIENSVTMCERLRTDTDSARTLFAANKLAV